MSDTLEHDHCKGECVCFHHYRIVTSDRGTRTYEDDNGDGRHETWTTIINRCQRCGNIEEVRVNGHHYLSEESNDDF